MLKICSTFALRSARYSLPGIRAISTSSSLLTGLLDDQGHVVIKDKPSQGKHGRPEHAFAPHHCQDLEVLSQIDDAIKETEEMMIGGSETARVHVHAHAAASAAADTDSPDSNYCDAHSNIDLHCVMQTMVPEPVDTNNGSPSHVNMPGGGQLRNDKYVYDNLHEIYPSRKYHTSARQYSSAPPEPKYWTGTDPCPQGVQGDDCERFQLWLENCRKYGLQDCDREVQGIQEGRKTVAQVIAEQDEMIRKINAHYKKNGDKDLFGQQKRGYASLVFPQRRHYCTKSDPPPPAGEVQISGAQKLKLAVKDYGSTVVVFHVSLSLASLGGFYLAVTSGIDMVGLLTKIGIGTQYLESGVLTGASTFVIAYAVHKVFAPVRIAITLSVTPFLVRYLRNIGLLKPPKAAAVKPADETESTPGGDSKTDKL